MDQVLIYENVPAIDSDVKSLENMLPGVQAVVDEIRKVGIQPSLPDVNALVTRGSQIQNERDLKSIVEDYVRDKLVDSMDRPNIGGITLSREKLAEMVDMPDSGLLLKKISALVYSQAGLSVGRDFVTLYSLEGEFVVIPDNTIQSIREKHRVYAQTEKQLKTFERVKAIVEASNILLDMHVDIEIKNEMILFQYHDKRYVVNYKAINRN